MSGERPWARHYFEEWQRRAGDPRLPYWLRVAALAYGSTLDNGHAPFKRGDIAVTLGDPGQPYKHVARAIDTAVEYGWLEEGSYWRCLIVPARAVKKGPYRSPTVCTLHTNTPLSGGFGGHSSTPSGGFEGRTRHSVAASQREPLFLICDTATTVAGPTHEHGHA